MDGDVVFNQTSIGNQPLNYKTELALTSTNVSNSVGKKFMPSMESNCKK